MPLALYRRHTRRYKSKRPEHDREWKKCDCPIWVEGKLDRWLRQSLKTSNWQRASEIVRDAEAVGRWTPTAELVPASALSEGKESVSLVAACERFLADAEHGRRISSSTLTKYRRLFVLLDEYCSARGRLRLDEIDVDTLRGFRASWSIGARTAAKQLERLKSFFRFAVESEWIAKNPALALKPPELKDTQKRPFEPEEVEAIFAECAKRGDDLLAFAMLLRYSGLRIGDAAWLEAERIKGDELFLYTQKSGTHVYVPLPPRLVQMLKTLPLRRGKYLFAGQSLRVETVPELWRQRLKRVFDAAGVEDAHPHRFRHTFAVELLKAGVPIGDVSVLLGHSSIRITERHYAAWVPARQSALRAHVQRTWG